MIITFTGLVVIPKVGITIGESLGRHKLSKSKFLEIEEKI
jgi:hypothetical protein